MLRSTIIAAAMLTAAPAIAPAFAGEMSAEEARAFVTGKLFNYTCFEGTRGAGRVFSDGSVVGTVQFQGSGPVRRAFLPAGTLQVKNGAVCASLKGLPFEPCFNLDRTDQSSFRGAISGFGFASCQFTRQNPRAVMTRVSEQQAETGEAADARAQAPAHEPIKLRPSLSAAAAR